jgi:hypothetical protein
MTMNRWIKRVSIALASTAMAGGALLGASGAASAATASRPVEHTQSSITAFSADGGRDGYRDGWDGHHRWDGHHSWCRDDDRRGWYLDQRVWYQDRSPWNTDDERRGWFLDQLVWAQDHR